MGILPTTLIENRATKDMWLVCSQLDGATGFVAKCLCSFGIGLFLKYDGIMLEELV